MGLFFRRANLKKSLREAKQQNKGQISNLKLELESAGCKISEVQRENDNKQYEIERLKLELKTIGENFEISRENMKELRDRCCSLIEKETENQVCRG
jgi:peptidoglycan hydrolase CwlO-like protein